MQPTCSWTLRTRCKEAELATKKHVLWRKKKNARENGGMNTNVGEVQSMYGEKYSCTLMAKISK